MSITKPNFVLVDYENTQKLELKKLKDLPVTVILFAGENQKTVPMDLLESALGSGIKMEINRAEATGSNALDMVLACYAGELASKQPNAYIHIVSKDKGFDALVKHLNSKRVLADRANSFADLKLLAPAPDYTTRPLSDLVHLAKKHLSKSTQPAKEKTLISSLAACFRKQLDKKRIEQVIAELKNSKFITTGKNGTLTYLA